MLPVLNDFRYGARNLRRSPGFTATAIAALAMGIAANTAVFSVVNKVLLEPLPYPDPGSLAQLLSASWIGDQTTVSIPKYLIWRDHATGFQEMAAYDFAAASVSLNQDDLPEALKAAHVSANYFHLFGAKAVLGQFFQAADDRPGAKGVAVISDRVWRRRFGGDPKLIGKTIQLEHEPFKVVGVMASGFALDPPADIWLPLQADPLSTDHLGRVRVAARLKPGVTLDDAGDQLSRTMNHYWRKYPQVPLLFREHFTAIPLRDAVVGDVKPALFLLAGAVGFLLLISCANAANLLLARSARRAREIAVRAALGAKRGQIVGQLLAESALLALVAGVLGLVLGYLGVRPLLALSPVNIPRIGANGSAITLDWRMFAFTLLVSVLTAVLFGLMPALNASRTNISSLVNDNASQSGMGFRRGRGRSALVVLEMALSLVLLAGAGLLIRTFVAARTEDRGFDGQNVLTLKMSLNSPSFSTTASVSELAAVASQRIRQVPGVSAVAASNTLPLEPSFMMPFTIHGRDQDMVGRYHGTAAWRSVSPGFFDALHIRLLRGRLFTEEDNRSGAQVVVIDRAMQLKFWQEIDANPIGGFITIGLGMGEGVEDMPRQIVGVVADVRDAGLGREPAMYVPLAQVPDGLTARNSRMLPIAWVIRTNGDPRLRATAIQEQLRQASGGRPIEQVQTMREVLAASSARSEFYTMLLSLFAGIAVVLAAVGLYGLMAYTVEQRTREIGIRLALGAAPADVRDMVMMQGMQLALYGILAGIPAALALTRVMVSMIFGIETWDPAVFGAVAALLGGVALAATCIPSLRATRVDPAVALRY